MGDTEDDVRYPPNPYGSSHHQKHVIYIRPSVGDQHLDDEEDEEDHEEDSGEEEDNGDDNRNNGVQHLWKDIDDDENEDEDEDDDNDKRKSNDRTDTKKRKLGSLVANYEFAPRVPVAAPPPTFTPSAPKLSFGGHNSLTDWTERETFVLLDSWGDRFLQCGRKSLMLEE